MLLYGGLGMSICTGLYLFQEGYLCLSEYKSQHLFSGLVGLSVQVLPLCGSLTRLYGNKFLSLYGGLSGSVCLGLA